MIELAYTMAYDAKVNYEDVFSQVRMWDNYIYYGSIEEEDYYSSKKEATKTEKYAGAMSKNQDSMIGWLVLTSTVCILILLCSTISHQRRSRFQTSISHR